MKDLDRHTITKRIDAREENIKRLTHDLAVFVHQMLRHWVGADDSKREPTIVVAKRLVTELCQGPVYSEHLSITLLKGITWLNFIKIQN